MQKGIKILAIIIFSVASRASALTFEQFTDSIVVNCVTLRAAAGKIHVAHADGLSAANLPDPEVSFDNVWGWKGIGNKLNLGISQSFDWPGLYGAKRQEAKAAMNVSVQEFRKEAFDVTQTVTTSLIEIAYYNKQLEILDSLRANTAALVNALERAFNNGEATILEVKKARLELLNVKSRISEAMENRETSIGSLMAMSSFPSIRLECENLELPQEGPILSDEDYRRAWTNNNPELWYLESQREQSLAATKVAKRSGYPSFSIGYLYNYEFGDYFNGFSVGLTLPIFSNRHKVKAAEAQSRADQRVTEAYSSVSVAEASHLREQAIMIKEHLKEYDQILDGSAEMARLLKRSLDAGQMSLTDYLVEINALTQGQLDRLDARRRLILTLQSLNRFNIPLTSRRN